MTRGAVLISVSGACRSHLSKREGYGVRSLILNLKFKIKDLTPKMHLRGDDLV